MTQWLDHVWIPAQLGTPVQGGGQPAGDPALGTGGSPPPGGGSSIIFWMLPLMILMFVMMAMSGRKQRKQHQKMLASLAKNDKVQTTGGIIGTIVEIKDREVVLRVDEQSSTRIRFARSAIAHVLRSQNAEEKPPADVAAAR